MVTISHVTGTQHREEKREEDLLVSLEADIAVQTLPYYLESEARALFISELNGSCVD